MSTGPALDLYRAADRLMRDDLAHYCARLVRIIDKSGRSVPLVFNEAQTILHERLEQQRQSHGWVRAIVLKARRLGISTYAGARFYHRTTMWGGVRSFILTHEDRATQELFGMARLIHDQMAGDFRPTATTANANELKFGGIDSGYRVGTAKNTSGLGRGLTLTLFHGSEVAFWPRAEQHFAGVMGAVPGLPETEVILESTGNGVGGEFYRRWQEAIAGRGDFIPIFISWMVSRDNRRTPEPGWQPHGEIADYAELYGLDEHQARWLDGENQRLGADDPTRICALFRQENPATAAEAFQFTGEESYIPGELVVQARNRTDVPDQPNMPRVLGVDVSRGQRDDTYIIDRQDRAAGRLLNVRIKIDDEYRLAEKLAVVLKGRPEIVRCYIDATSIGGGTYAILKNNGFADIVRAVNFGAGADRPDRYVNKRAEIHARMKDWLRDPRGVSIPDDDKLHGDIVATGFHYQGIMGHGERLILEPKEQVVKRVKFSPDGADALALTFTETTVPDRLAVSDDDPRREVWWQESYQPDSDPMTA